MDKILPTPQLYSKKRYLSNKKAPIKSAILIDCNQIDYLIIKQLLADAKMLENIPQHLIGRDFSAHNLCQMEETLAEVL